MNSRLFFLIFSVLLLLLLLAGMAIVPLPAAKAYHILMGFREIGWVDRVECYPTQLAMAEIRVTLPSSGKNRLVHIFGLMVRITDVFEYKRLDGKPQITFWAAGFCPDRSQTVPVSDVYSLGPHKITLWLNISVLAGVVSVVFFVHDWLIPVFGLIFIIGIYLVSKLFQLTLSGLLFCSCKTGAEV